MVPTTETDSGLFSFSSSAASPSTSIVMRPDDGLVGLDLYDGLVFFDLVALLYEPLYHLTLGYPLAQVR
jgi:hypothetical protein